MERLIVITALALGACNAQPAQQSGPSVTVTLPPPKAVPAPGFSVSLADAGR